jgi:hypothetical protein
MLGWVKMKCGKFDSLAWFDYHGIVNLFLQKQNQFFFIFHFSFFIFPSPLQMGVEGVV